LLTDHFAFPQLLSILIWLLVVIPLLLVATAFFIWGLRGQFPWLDPFYPVTSIALYDEDNNSLHAFLMFFLFLFLAIMATKVIFKL